MQEFTHGIRSIREVSVPVTSLVNRYVNESRRVRKEETGPLKKFMQTVTATGVVVDGVVVPAADGDT